jgi:hypothetical protein
LRSGRVIFRNRMNADAPKTSAASLYSRGISWRPATRMTRTIAVARQISATAIPANSATGVS